MNDDKKSLREQYNNMKDEDKKTFKGLMIFSVVLFLIIFIALPIIIGYFNGNVIGGLKVSGALVALGVVYTLADFGIHKFIEREDSQSLFTGFMYGIVVCIVIVIIYEKFFK